MKKIAFFLCLLTKINILFAQDNITLKDLAVPASPAFILTDATPSLVQTPNIPKAFILGIAQSFQQSSGGFPQDYSAEFAPYWWSNPKRRDVYNFLGLKTQRKGNQVDSVIGENPFNGLKFASISTAFLNKDLIPDTFSNSQKIFSIGVRTTIVKIHLKNYAANLNNKLKFWHETALTTMPLELETELSKAGDDMEKRKEVIEKIKEKYSKQSKNASILGEINDIVSQKPIFSWDIAAAYAVYGINDSLWKNGRSGIWTTLSSYIPLDLGGEKPNKNYFNLNFSFRYLFDNYHKDEKGLILKSSSVDFGGKIALEFDQFSIGIESLYRYYNGSSNTQNRTVGLINYRIANNIYLTGAFGKNFESSNKLISLFGINWGFGSEGGSLPE